MKARHHVDAPEGAGLYGVRPYAFFMGCLSTDVQCLALPPEFSKSGPVSGESLRFESGLASKESFSLKERYSHLQEMPRQWLFLHHLV